MINNILKYEIVVFLIGIVLFLILYFPRFIAWFGAIKKQPQLINKKKNKIAVIIPARNEEKVISTLFDSLKSQTYDKDLYDVYVILKDEGDPVAKMTLERGYNYFTVNNQTCKGDALDYCLKRLIALNPNKFDAYIVVDADCLLADNYLEEMNNALASDRMVVLSKKVVKNYLSNAKGANSLTSSANGIIWTLIDDMGNRFKSDHKIPIMTIGTGLMLRADLVLKLGGWPYRKTLTEDMEFMYDCELNDYSTFYYSRAVIYVEEALTLSMTNKRRTRWLMGVVDSKRLYHDEIVSKKTSKRARINHYFTTNLNLVYLYVGLCVFFFFGNLIFSTVLFISGNRLWEKAFLLAIFSLVILYSSFFIMTLVAMIVDRRNIRLSFIKKIMLLFYHPIFYMGYIPIIFKALFFKGHRDWEVIDRMDFEKIE